MYTSQQYTSQHKTNHVKWHGRWQEANHVYRQNGETSSLVSWPKCTQVTSARFQHPGSGNLLTHSWQPSHCTIIIHGCYVHKAWSTTHSVTPWRHAVWGVQYWKTLHFMSIREYYWPKTKYVTVSAVRLIQYWTRGEQPWGWGLYKSYSTCQVATDDVSVNASPSTSRPQTLLVCLYVPKAVL